MFLIFLPTIVTDMHRCIEMPQRSSSLPDSDLDLTSPTECYECTRVDAPQFHSTRCQPGTQPEWEALAGSSLFPAQNKCSNCGFTEKKPQSSTGPFGRVLDPRSKNVKRVNRLTVLARGVSLALDPLFLFAISVIPSKRPCIYIDGTILALATVLRTCVDAVHLFYLWLQFRLAYVSRESLVVGNGKLVWDARAIVAHYVGSIQGFWFDAFVILPIPQFIYWLALPKLLGDDEIEHVITIVELIFLIQFIPKVYHCFSLMRRLRKVTGYIFGTVWWGFTLNLIAYLLASHVFGGYWYILSIRRIATCLTERCETSKQCDARYLTCPEEICFNTYGNPCDGKSTMKANFLSMCLHPDGAFPYGLYEFALPLITKNSNILNILYSNLWGLMAISTMANNLEPRSETIELLFAIIMVLSGLALFTSLIGNIQVFLHAVTVRRRRMQLRYRDMEWWMRRRRLPPGLKQRVRHFEHQTWTTMGGQDETELIEDLPDGLRRDIKRHLCLDLVKKVPLFHNLDDLILDHICDRVKPTVFSKDEKIMREGDPVQRMVFIVDGRIQRSQNLRKGMFGISAIESGDFLGDELLSWCLRRPYIDRLPASSATFTCIEPTEAFALDYNHLLYITDHFRYTFSSRKVKSTARYYSSNWRTWAAVIIQLAWRRHLERSRGDLGNRGSENGDGNDRRLWQYAAMFMSRPHDHLE